MHIRLPQLAVESGSEGQACRLSGVFSGFFLGSCDSHRGLRRLVSGQSTLLPVLEASLGLGYPNY